METNPHTQSRRHGRRLLPTTLLLPAVLALAAFAIPNRAAAQFASTTLSPSTQTVDVGNPCSVDIVFAVRGYATNGMQAWVKFDPSKLQAVSVTTGASSPFTNVFANTIDNTNGTVTYGAKGGTVTNTTFSAARIVFTPVGAGTSAVTFLNVNQYIGASVYGVNGLATGGSITVNALPAPPEIFRRTSANGEGWQLYTIAFSPTHSGNYTLGFNIVAPGPTLFYGGDNSYHSDHSIYLDDVRLAGSNVSFQSGFESPVVTVQQVYPNGAFGDWVFANYSGVIPGSPSQWGSVGPKEGGQRGFVQSYNGTLSNVKSGNIFSLVAGQTYTVSYYQASRAGPVGNEGVLTYTVSIDEVASPAPVVTSASATAGYGASFSYQIVATNSPSGYSISGQPAGLSVDGSGLISGTLPNAVGTFTINLNATNAGGTGSGTLMLHVVDLTPPVITAASPVTAEATGPTGAAVTFTATANDFISGNVAVTATPASGSTFGLGLTSVSLSATDGAHNTATKNILINVTDTTPPTLSLPANITKEATSASGAVATYSASATDLVDGPVGVTLSPASGSTFGLGTTTVNATATDSHNNTAGGSFTVTVKDTTAPVITSLTASSATLWPANHKMVAISLTATATDAVTANPTFKIASVTSSEPDNGLGDGDTAGDIEITGAMTLNLRAERSGSGNGRTYTITVQATDGAGNASTKTVTVSVPKSQGK